MYTLIRLIPLFWQQPPPTISDRVKKQKMRSRKCFLLFWADFVYDLGYLITIKSCRGRTLKHTVPGRECVYGWAVAPLTTFLRLFEPGLAATDRQHLEEGKEEESKEEEEEGQVSRK